MEPTPTAEPQAQAVTEPLETVQTPTAEPVLTAPVQENKPQQSTANDFQTEAAAAEEALQKLLNPEPVKAEPEAKEEATQVEEEPSGETPVEEPEAKVEAEPSERYRFKDAKDQAVASLAKAEGISLIDAAKLYSEKLAPVAAQTEQVAPAPELPREIARLNVQATALDGEIAELETQIDTQLEGGQLMTPELRKMQADLHRKIATRENVKASIDTAYRAERTRDRETLVKRYPDLGDDTTPLGLTVTAIISSWKDPEHPRHADIYRPDAVKLASEAAVKSYAGAIAKKSGITLEEAMRSLETEQPVSQQQKPAAKPQPKIAPASGTRTSVASQTQAKPQTFAQLKAEAGEDPDKLDALARYLATGRPEPLVQVAL